MRIKELKRKINLFTKKHLYYLIPFNYKLKPTGLYPTLDNYVERHKSEESIYQEILPKTSSELCLTDEMLKVSSDYVNYQLKVIEPAKFIVRISNGRILTDQMWTIAIFDELDRIVGDISLDMFQDENQSIADSRLLKRKYFQPLKYFKGTVFPTVGGGGTYINTAHWLIDSLSRIYLLKKSGLFDEVDWFYVPSIEYDYQRDSLTALGIPESKIIESTKFPHISADNILVSSYTRSNYYHMPKWVVTFYTNYFPPRNVPVYKSKKYFISRKDSSLRHILNEDELSSFLEKYGFETVVLSEMSFQEKIDLFAYADVVISLWGAGLVNLLFCKEGTKVVEMFGEQHVDFTLYYDIAVKKNLEYHYLIGQNKHRVNNWQDGQRSDVFISLDLLKNLVEKDLKIIATN